MPDLVKVNYAQTGKSTNTNAMGMRAMQARAYDKRNAQYLLIKSPPASGKSRALMFIALDKLRNQGIKKIVVAVPEKSIGGSFQKTDLAKYGFFEDWSPNPIYNLCTPGGDGSKSKIKSFLNFLNNEEEILICTHATLRFAYQELEEAQLNHTLIAIDEFHHVSAHGENRLGELLRGVMEQSSAHIVAMTGSYFRGDSVPVLAPEHEALFTPVTYNYYEQLDGYQYLKSLGIGYHFYTGKYLSAISEVLDTNKKTILHIPSVNSGESTKDKYQEVDKILDSIGDFVSQDEETGVITIKRKGDKKRLKVADLVNDDPKQRDKIMNYLREIKSLEDMDLIIALGMAKEGFDWSYCEHALTVGYRGSLTEIVQIIGRATRDSNNKTHAQFTNLIAKPDAEDETVTKAVNDILKAITASLLMEQVLAPSFKFRPRKEGEDSYQPGELKIRGFKKPSSQRVGDILEADITDLKAAILQDTNMQKTITGNVDAEVVNKVLIPKIIHQRYPDLSEEEVEEIRQHVVVDTITRGATIEETGDKRFIRMADKFINIDDLHIDLIDQINPFHNAYEILSKSVDTSTLKLIGEAISSSKVQMTDEEAVILYGKIPAFKANRGRLPDIHSLDPLEKRMAEAIVHLRNLKRKQLSNATS